jgi:DNA topoisomerase-3
MKVCIAEKPSVAREIAQILGATQRLDGYFEGNGYQVTWTFGHFCTLFAPDEYHPHWKRWDLNSLPMLPEKFQTRLMSDKGVKKQFGVIKRLFKKASLVINCGDAGQEGELIQRWVINEAKYKGPVQRLWISSLTKDAITTGFGMLKPASDFDSLYHSGFARAIGDWLLGMNATRLYTIKYGGGKLVLSIGRVQTPTLAMLVKRHLEIINFVSKPFWELETVYKDTSFRYEKGRFEKVEDGQGILQEVTDHPFTITSVVKKKGKEYAPRLFDLTGLQVHANKRFGYSADMTLKIVQRLYEKKVVTYPRVDTTYLPDDMYPKIGGILKGLTNYSQFVQPLMGAAIRKTKRVFDDKKVTDHHAIVPTGVQLNLAGEEWKIYNAITKRFIANFYPDCIVNNTTAIGAVKTYKFKATGKEIEEPGWRVVYAKVAKVDESDSNNDSTSKKKEEKILPSFTQGESGPHAPSLVEKSTQPPKYYTDATLLRAMESAGKTVDDEELTQLMKENGIGRPSTRAAILEKLYKRRYAIRKKKAIHPTDLGVQLIETIENDLLKSAELTGRWERKLRLIEKKEYDPAKFIVEMKAMTAELVDGVRMSKQVSKIDTSQIPDRKYGKKKNYKSNTRVAAKRSRPKSAAKKTKVTECSCPRCKKGMLLKGSAAFGCSEYKAGCTFKLPFIFMEKKISENQILRLLSKGSTVNLKGFKRGQNKVDGVIKFDQNWQLMLIPPKASMSSATTKSPTKSKMICPKCKVGEILKGKTAYGCSAWKSGCDFRYPFDVLIQKMGKRKPTASLVKTILSSQS